MPRLSDHERYGAVGILQAGVRVSVVARYYQCHANGQLYSASEIVTRLLGQLKIDAGLVNQE